MKRIIFAVVAVSLLTSSSVLAQTKFEKKNLFGVNPLGLVFKIYSGEYGRFLDDEGAVEVNVPFFYWAPLDELTIFGLGAKYRMYKDKNGEGIFYGGGISFGSVSWDYETISLITFQTTTESVTAFVIGPEGEVGYRWRWENNLTLAPSLTLGYRLGRVEAADGTVPSTDPAGFSWGIGLGLAYMF